MASHEANSNKQTMQRSALAASLLFLFSVNSFALAHQTNPKWQVGTIMAVSPHPVVHTEGVARKYDVSIKVGNTLYVVLYVSQDGSSAILHRAGIDLLVSVGTKTIAFNSLMGKRMEAPILSQRPMTPASGATSNFLALSNSNEWLRRSIAR